MSYDYEYIVRQKKRSNSFQLLTLQLTHNENEKNLVVVFPDFTHMKTKSHEPELPRQAPNFQSRA